MVLKTSIVITALIAVGIVVVFAMAAAKPQTFQIRRSMVIAAPAENVYGLTEWKSKGSAGAGRMEITDAEPPNRLSIQVDWVRPFQSRNLNEFTLEPEGSATRVTWTMHGPNLFPCGPWRCSLTWTR